MQSSILLFLLLFLLSSPSVISYNLTITSPLPLCIGRTLSLTWTLPFSHSNCTVCAYTSTSPTASCYPLCSLPQHLGTIGSCSISTSPPFPSSNISLALDIACDDQLPPFNRHTTGTSLLMSPPSDACGVCGGSNATCTGCDGVPNSGRVVDSCGVCGGSDQTCSSSYSIAPVSLLPSSGLCPGSLTTWRWTAPANHSATTSLLVILSSDGIQGEVYRLPLPLFKSSGVATASPFSSSPLWPLLSSSSPGSIAASAYIAETSGGSNVVLSNVSSFFVNTTRALDACGVCGGSNATCTGCDGVPNSGKVIDACGVCGGGNASCTGCDGVLHSMTKRDACGVCGGSNATCRGCDGVPSSGKKIDDCGVCGGSGGCSLMQSVIADSTSVCLGKSISASWVAPLNRSSSTRLGIFARDGESWKFFPEQLCALPAGATTGRCSFPTESLSNGSHYSLQFYSDSKPLRNPSAVVAIGGRADACGVCGGSNATCTGCDGLPNSGKKIDSCGVCGGSCDDPFAISFVNPQSDYQRSYICGGCPLKLQWTSPSLNRTAAGILAYSIVSIPSLSSPQLLFSYPLPSSGVSGLLSMPSPTLRPDWAAFAAFNPGSVFDVKVYLLSQQPLQPISPVAMLSLNASSLVDACGVCGGSSSSCTGCDGVPNSGKVVDDCGVCGGTNACVGLVVNTSFCINAVPAATWFLPSFQPLSISVAVFKQPQLQFPIDILSLPATSRGVLSLSGFIPSIGSYYFVLSALVRNGSLSNMTVKFPTPQTEVGAPSDVCGVCGGDNSTCKGCDGVPNSGKKLDACDVCGGDGKSCAGCDGVAKSGKVLDACGVCGGSNATCTGCDGVPNSGKKIDSCGVCGGSDSSCLLDYAIAFVYQLCASSSSVAISIIVPSNHSFFDTVVLLWSNSPGTIPSDPPIILSSKTNTLTNSTQIITLQSSRTFVSGMTLYAAYLVNATHKRATTAVVTVNASASDRCGVCGGSNACVGCDGVPFSGAVIDRCGVCGGRDACVGCDDVPFSGKKIDACGVCGGSNATCTGCDGVPNSGKKIDSCGVCGGTNSTCGGGFLIELLPALLCIRLPFNVTSTGPLTNLHSLGLWVYPILQSQPSPPISRLFPAQNSSLPQPQRISVTMAMTAQTAGQYRLSVNLRSKNTWEEALAVTPVVNVSACVGCDGVPNSGKVRDVCGMCDGDSTSCMGCDRVPNSGKKIDACGVCGGSNATCTGCDGVPNSGRVVDSCGVCGGSDQTCTRALNISAPSDVCTLLPVQFAWTGPSNHTSTSFFYFEATVGDFTYSKVSPLLPRGVSVGVFSLVFDEPGVYSIYACTKSASCIFVTASMLLRACFGCDGVLNSGKVFDSCGVCGGGNTACATSISLSLSLPAPFCYGLAASLRWTAPYNHSRNDSIVLTFNQQRYPPIYSPPISSSNGSVVITNCTSSVPSSALCLPSGPGLVVLRYFLFDGTRETEGASVNFTMSDKVVDGCGVCGGKSLSCAGCDGVPNSGKKLDACDVCGGDGKSCAGCDGVAKSGKVLDACGVCGGSNATCTGCDGVPNSGKKIDDCGKCGGSGGCVAPLKMWSNNRMCIQSQGMELHWQVAVNSTNFRFTVLTKTPSISLLASCSFSAGSFPLAAPTGTCLINSFQSESFIIAGPCSCITKRDFTVNGTYKVEAFLNYQSNQSTKVEFDIAVGNKADDCGECGGDNSTCAGCDGVPNSGKVVDRCYVCGGSDACVGCDDVPFSDKTLDACGVCGGSNATCTGCDGVPNSGRVYDRCGICGGNGQLCVLDPRLSATRYNFCAGLDLQLNWVAPINHSGSDVITIFSKTNDTVIDQYYLPLQQYQGSVTVTSSKSQGTDIIQVPSGWSNVIYAALTSSLAFLDVGPILFDSQVSSDVCGVCGGNGQSCLGCDGVPNSGKVVDVCGVCGGDGSSCAGCDNPDSGRVRDDCGVCNGKGGCVPFSLTSSDKPAPCNLRSFSLAFTASFPRARTRVAILNASSAASAPSYVAAIDMPPALINGKVLFDTPWDASNNDVISDPWGASLLPRYLPTGSYIALIFVLSPSSSAPSNSTAFKVAAVDVCGVCGGDGSSCAKSPSIVDEILSQYSTGQLVGFGFAALFGLIILCYAVYKIVECYKRKRTLSRLQSHYQLKEPGAGLHSSVSRKSEGQAGRVSSPVSVQMRPMSEQGSDEPFASLNPLTHRGKGGGGAAAGSSRSRLQGRGSRESPDAVEMQLAAGSRVSAGGASVELVDDDFADFVSAEDAVVPDPGVGVPAAAPHDHQSIYAGTRVALGGVGGGISAPPVSRAAGGGSASKSSSPAALVQGHDESTNASALSGVALSPILRDTVSPEPLAVSLQASAQLPSSSSFRPVESSTSRRASLPGLPGSSIGPDAVSLSIKVCEDDVIKVTMEAQLSQDVLLGEEKALITFVCMHNSDDVVDDVSIRLATAKGMTSSMGAPSSTTLSPHEDSITQVFLLTARGKITKKGIVKFKIKLEYSVKGQKHFKEFEMKNLWALAIGSEASERVALNSSL